MKYLLPNENLIRKYLDAVKNTFENFGGQQSALIICKYYDINEIADIFEKELPFLERKLCGNNIIFWNYEQNILLIQDDFKHDDITIENKFQYDMVLMI